MMGKKQQPIRKWEFEDVAHLLAWLDHCIEHGGEFKSTVCEHLEDKLEKKYTWDQISSKLGKLRDAPNGKRGKRMPSAKLDREGTKCLPWLGDDLIEQIKHLKSTLPITKAHRKSYKLGSKSTVRSCAADVILERQSQTTSPLSSVATTPRLTTPSDGNGEQRYLYAANMSDTKIDLSREPSQFTTFRRTAEPPSYSPITAMLRKQVQESGEMICRLNKDLMTKENYILQLKIKLDSTTKELEEIQECLKTGENSDAAALVARLQYSESILKQQLAKVRPLLMSIPSREKESNNTVWSNIKRSMYTLERDILNACTNLQDWAYNEEISSQAFSDHADALEPLARRVFASGMSELTLAFTSDSEMQLDFLRILVIANIFIYVFETNVFDFLSHESALLAKYRECLLLKDGPYELKSIDWLAHEALISESSFRLEVLETKATELASHLLKTLLPLWSVELADKLAEHKALLSGLDPYKEYMLSTDNILTQFQKVYVDALMLKFDLVLTGNRFRADFVQPGSPFSPRLMNKDGFTFDYQTPKHKKRNEMGDHTVVIEPRQERVKLCLFPVIYRLPSAKRNTDAIVTSDTRLWTLDFMNFNASEEELTSASFDLPVCKAVISV